jgi:hypothetical protein
MLSDLTPGALALLPASVELEPPPAAVVLEPPPAVVFDVVFFDELLQLATTTNTASAEANT